VEPRRALQVGVAKEQVVGAIKQNISTPVKRASVTEYVYVLDQPDASLLTLFVSDKAAF
jgi:hypothetical protein